MNLTKYSKNKLMGSLAHYKVDRDFADPIYNYIVFGFEPGSFFTSVLANDFMDAVSRSHPGNSMVALKNIVSWIVNELPEGVTYGSYAIVDKWLTMTELERRHVLEERKLIYTEKEEIIMVLKDEKTTEPFFW